MSETRSDLTLQAALRLMGPLVKLLLREGVDYSRYANAVKTTFLEQAEQLLNEGKTKITDSGLSTLSGVHRKDVRAWRTEGNTLPAAHSLNPAMELFARWTSDPAYCSRNGKPCTLDRAGEEGSFEALARSVSNDVHPRTLLNVLIRLGVAELVEGNTGGEQVKLRVDAFVPKGDLADMLTLFADNLGDHMAAAVHNLASQDEPLLEQSVYANELRPESVAALNQLGRQLWAEVLKKIVTEATRLSAVDEGHPEAKHRARLGMYFYQDLDETK